jgi:hypothetical protein
MSFGHSHLKVCPARLPKLSVSEGHRYSHNSRDAEPVAQQADNSLISSRKMQHDHVLRSENVVSKKNENMYTSMFSYFSSNTAAKDKITVPVSPLQLRNDDIRRQNNWSELAVYTTYSSSSVFFFLHTIKIETPYKVGLNFV